MISNIIHYCWLGSNPSPTEFIKRLNDTCGKDFTIKEWNDSNISEFPIDCELIKRAKQDNNYAYITDYLRLQIIYKYGGIYIDTDVEVLKSYKPLLNYKAFCSSEWCKDKNGDTEWYVNFGSGVGAEPNEPMIQEIIEFYKSLDKELLTTNNYVYYTSPWMQSEIMWKHGYEGQENETVTAGNFTILKPEYLCPKYWKDKQMYYLTDNTYSIHHFDKTWDSFYKKYNNIK